MTAPAQRAAGLPGCGARTGTGGRSLWPVWMPIVPALVTLAVTLWRIGAASFWRDEAATLTAARRQLPEMIRMFARVDAVHGAYYLVIWPLAHLFGTSEFVMRLPSAIAMAAAAFGTAVIGRRLGSPQTGLLAGLVFAALPMTSRFGQEARSYAMVTAVAVLASYLLLRGIGE
ncbi:MAG TPA: glycosyltransferase family 39 protein, partial [Streptosporangiaceae bacterium]|nr:glycosyltransferase family 39 protein [Streptosporangiaceae bacterium]